jgi:hypothetical protein
MKNEDVLKKMVDPTKSLTWVDQSFIRNVPLEASSLSSSEHRGNDCSAIMPCTISIQESRENFFPHILIPLMRLRISVSISAKAISAV